MIRSKQKRKLILAILGASLLLFFVGAWIFATTTVPNFGSLDQRKIIQSTKIYDRTGQILLYDIHGDVQRTVVPLDQIPKHVRDATIAMEDQNFYSHYGISPTSIIRAFFVNLFSGEIKQGGSTITQQLIKNTFLTPDKTLSRKIKEIILSMKVELRYSKDEILGFYLNEVPYGQSAYGIEAASQTYFGKPAKDLTIAEGAYLASMLQAPTRYSPYGSHRDELESRKNIILNRLYDGKMISREQYEESKNEQVVFAGKIIGGIRAPHFSLYIREYLVEKYGEDVVEKGGLKVTTTLNWEWQEKLEELIKNAAVQNERNFSAYNEGLVATDPKTGQILVMIGSRDYFMDPRPEGCAPGIDCKFDPQVNMTLRSRQPGSSFKPFVYATSFKRGYSPNTVLFDTRTEFSTQCSPWSVPDPGVDPEKCYNPGNFDDKFRGPVTLKDALAQSVNIVAVKVLYLAGTKDSISTARDLGISTLTNPERYGLTLVLGGGEVKLLEMTNAYGAFANGGFYTPHTPILKIEDGNGSILEEYHDQRTQALDTNIANQINDMLVDNSARAPAFTENSPMYIPERPVAVKTGTTQDTRDTWIIGYTPNIVMGVWAGNNDNSKMVKKVAGLIVAPIWNAAMHEVIKDLPVEEFTPPEIQETDKPVIRGEWKGNQEYKIDKLTGKLATEYTPEELIEKKVIQEVHSILYWVDKNNPLGPAPSNPNNDPQFKNWEASVREWALSHGYFDETAASIPLDRDNIHLPELAPRGEIVLVPSQDNYPSGARIRIRINSESYYPIDQIDVFKNSEFIGSYKSTPFEFSMDINGESGKEIKISATIYDNVRNKTVIEKNIRISGS
ncbi:penicillin-binding protein [Candidatus Giovannonibacteria bacterium]|nr:penicillin-binding protein [Candidatus Giovannonibacteria bacterium]